MCYPLRTPGRARAGSRHQVITEGHGILLAATRGSGRRRSTPAGAMTMTGTAGRPGTYVLVDDAISAQAVAIAARPGPVPACTGAELLAIALVRHLLGRRSEAGFLAGVARDRAHRSRGCRTKARRTGGSAGSGARSGNWGSCWRPGCPADDCQQADTTALPVKHTSRVRGPDGWTGTGNDLAARFGRDTAHPPP